MTPAAVDFRSPITSSQRSQSTQPSSFQNPNPAFQGPPTFGSFSSDNRSQQDSKTVESLNIGKASDATFNWSFSSPFTSQMNSEKPIPSATSGRSRPRLLKVRKQSSSHSARSNSVSAENNSVHNFFPSTSENLRRANDSTATPNGFSASVTEGNKFTNLQNPGLQFGANKGDSVLNSNMGQSDAGEFGKFDNLGFVFGANNPLPNVKKNECKLKRSAVNQSNMEFDSNSGTSRGSSSIDEMRKFDYVGFGSQKYDNMAFSFDSNLAKSEPTSSSKAGETSENVERYNEREENKSEFRKVDNGDFLFDANKNIGKLVPDIGGEMKLENGGDSSKFDYGGFAFGTSSSGMKSNSKLRHLASNAYLKSKEWGRNAGKSDFADTGKMNVDVKTKSQKDEVNGAFIFGSGSKESSTVDGMNKLKSERAEKCNGFMKSQIPIFNVSQKFQTLNIRDSEKHGDSDPSTGISGISSSDQLKRGDLGNAFEKIYKADTKANLKRVFEFGNSEKNHPVNLTEERLDGTQYTENQPNKASFPSSSIGFRFQASEAPPVDRVEKEKFNFTGFSTPSLNTPYSFTNNMSSDLSKKLEFSANGSRSVTEIKSKKTRGKPRQHNKVHLSKEEDNSQQNHQKSPESFSPMDFSPYQAASSVPTKSKDEESNYNWAGIASEEAGGGICEDKQEEATGGRKQFSFATTSGNSEERKSSFSLSSAQENLATAKRYKKYRMKTGSGLKFNTPSGKGGFASLWLDAEEGKEVKRPDSERKGDTFPKANEEHVKLEPTESPTLEACQSWRSRGNKAYRNGDLSIADDFYTKGINAIPHTNISGCFIEALVLCYSNRATTRLALGRMREALEDCRMASSLDPNFLKVHIRAANCHLVLGEVEEAIQYFSKCLESGNEVCLDRRITIEAADGVQKAKKVIDCTNSSAELLKQKTSDAANNALGIINEALSTSCYSEILLEMKGEALCMLRKYEEVVQICERTLDFAEKNFAAVDCGSKNSYVRLWRWRLMSKSYFYLGKLDVALDFIEKQEQLKSINNNFYASRNQESSVNLAFTVRELLLRKNAGNEAFQFGKHTEAIEHYTAAISSSVESRSFAAVCFCNRAAAHQALGQITDAIADCSLSIALDGNYTKALSRRATLHEMIRDYEQAANDLQKLVSVLENQSQEKSQKSGGSVKDLRRTRHRLSSMEEKARKGTPLDLYMILGIKASDPASEIKKAYRKAALRHHPDKAGQFLARCEIGDDGCLYKEIAEKIHTDADRLFKMIGEAYAVLSDPGKRSKYDLQEEMRDDEDEYRSSSFGRASNFNSSPFESSSNNRRYWKESWKTYGHSSSRW